MAILKFQNNVLQLFNDSDRVLYTQRFCPGTADSDKRDWIDKADAYAVWDSRLASKWSNMVDLDTLVKE